MARARVWVGVGVWAGVRVREAFTIRVALFGQLLFQADEAP